jgi:hypothetical protein
MHSHSHGHCPRILSLSLSPSPEHVLSPLSSLIVPPGTHSYLLPHSLSLRHRRVQTVTAGLSNRPTWYQYGFSKPQGPIERKAVDGDDVRRVARFVVRRARLRPLKNRVDVVVFSRSRNRRITNEDGLVGTRFEGVGGVGVGGEVQR